MSCVRGESLSMSWWAFLYSSKYVGRNATRVRLSGVSHVPKRREPAFTPLTNPYPSRRRRVSTRQSKGSQLCRSNKRQLRSPFLREPYSTVATLSSRPHQSSRPRPRSVHTPAMSVLTMCFRRRSPAVNSSTSPGRSSLSAADDAPGAEQGERVSTGNLLPGWRQ
jgi:hypothetical protein